MGKELSPEEISEYEHLEAQESQDAQANFIDTIATNAIRKSKKIIKKFDIAKKLGTNSAIDAELFTLYFSQKIIKTEIFNISKELSDPLAATGPEVLPEKNQILFQLEEMTRNFETFSYSNPQRSNLIGLSINHLIAIATDGDRQEGKELKIRLTKDMVSKWAHYWQPQINS